MINMHVAIKKKGGGGHDALGKMNVTHDIPQSFYLH